MNKKTLADCKCKQEYRIKNIEISDKKLLTALTNLGFKPDENITLLKSNYGKKSYLVNIIGISYAIDKSICEKIFIYDK